MIRPLHPPVMNNNHVQPIIGNNRGPRSPLISLILYCGMAYWMVFRSGRPESRPDTSDTLRYSQHWFFENQRNLPTIALWADKKVVHRAVQQEGLTLRALGSNREVVLSAVKHFGLALKFASEALRANEEVVFSAVRQHGGALQYASEALRSNPYVVLTAIKDWEWAIEFASKGLQSNRDFMLKVIRTKGSLVSSARESLLLDRNFLLEAVRQNGRTFWHLPRHTRSNCDFILAVANNHPHALRLARIEGQQSEQKLYEVTSQSQPLLPINQTAIKNNIRDTQKALLMLRSVQQALQSGGTQEASVRNNCSNLGFSRGYLRSNRYGLFARNDLQTVHSREISK